MIWFAAKKVLGLVVTLVAAAAIVFVVLDLLPGATSDQPALERFLRWLAGMLVGDFGTSTSLGAPVGPLIAERLAVTLPLVALATLLAFLIGGLVGLGAARRSHSIWAKAVMASARLSAAVPDFWLGMLLVLLFALTLRWLPQGGFVPWQENAPGALQSLILPGLAIAAPLGALLARAVHDAVIAVKGAEFVRAAEARGLTRREAMQRHGLRNAALEVLSRAGPAFALLIVSAVVVENVFYLPGLGRLILDAVGARDVVLVRGGLAILVFAVAGTMFLIDLLEAWADPRLRAWSPL
jgi:peptide/nickel transport system permease protein